MSIKLLELILRIVFATKVPDLPKRRVTGLWYRDTWGVVLGTNVSRTRMRSRSGETGTKLAKAGQDRYKIMTFGGTHFQEFKKTIRKEIKSGPFKTRGGGGGFTGRGWSRSQKR